MSRIPKHVNLVKQLYTKTSRFIHTCFPPLLSQGFDFVSRLLFRRGIVTTGILPLPAIFFLSKNQGVSPREQNLSVYETHQMAENLEIWGEGTAWTEIQLLLSAREGRVLDMACGTGAALELLSRETDLEIHGCDISDFFIRKAIARGIAKERLKVCDATATSYPDKFFDYSFSIGSLEHFTEEGIESFLKEARRITRFASFHQIPVSRSNQDEGWITLNQSFFHNSQSWWLTKFEKQASDIRCIESQWNDFLSWGKWFVCRYR